MRLHDILRYALFAFAVTTGGDAVSSLYVSRDVATCINLAAAGECATKTWGQMEANWLKAPHAPSYGDVRIQSWYAQGSSSTSLTHTVKLKGATPNSDLVHVCARANVSFSGSITVTAPDGRVQTAPWSWDCANGYEITPNTITTPGNGVEGNYVVRSNGTKAVITPKDINTPLDQPRSAYLYVYYDISLGSDVIQYTYGLGFGAAESYVPTAHWAKTSVNCVGVNECTASNTLYVGTDSAPRGTKFTVKHEYVIPSGDLYITKLNEDGIEERVDMSEHSIELSGSDNEQIQYLFNVKGNGTFSIPVNTTVTYM
ncbi:Uncharacterised protein [Escherichia coli]|nr:hypothetical protein [Escherichia coli]OLR86262.1 hypothetical protein BUE81_16280 [Escherichia coli]SRC45595.1 Uncharacterised protein [Escherichia coli]